MPEVPSRYVGVTATCGLCGQVLQPGRARQWCSDACRQAAYRRRQQPGLAPAVLPPVLNVRDHIVYQCSSCEQRYLGLQRCPECQIFCRRLGPGGNCPHCDEPVALADLTMNLPPAQDRHAG